YFDPKSKTDDPRWSVVDIRSEAEFAEPVTLPELRDIPELEEMVLLRKGSRLSVQPVTEKEWKIITKSRKIRQL
ncbi:MAG: EVE domain-containing protein, partial [Calditrichaeota bacterium]|nr:EVE domain-containing protein [Calditrichota bacterium]